MAGQVYTRGDGVTLTASWLVNEVPTDPAGVVFQTKDPNGNTVTYTYGTSNNVTRVSAGVYQCVVTVSLSGWWYWRAQGTGASPPFPKNGEDSFIVAPSQF